MLNKFFKEKGLSESTKAHYKAAVKIYQELTGKTLTELLEEAEIEEEKRIRWKHRSVKTYLIDFRNYLYENKSEGTVIQYLSDIKAIYKHYEIELQDLPTYNSKQIDKTYEKKFEDVLTKDELVQVYYSCNNVCKCIVLFAMSSGISKKDLLNLKVSNFINACAEFITEKELRDQLKELKSQTVIPCFIGKRAKTKTSYTTFCSPEASEHIIHYLLDRDASIRQEYDEAEDKEGLPTKLELDDDLFKISYSRLYRIFREINYALGLGKVGKATKFRCHQLRTFHASTLLNCKCSNFSEQEIDALQGRKKSQTRRAYLIDSKTKLYDKYIACVDELMLFKSIHEVDKDEYHRIENENRELKSMMDEQSKEIEKIKELQAKLEEMVAR